MQILKQTVGLSTLLLITSQIALAMPTGKYFGTIDVGAGFAKLGRTDDINLTGPIINTYKAKRNIRGSILLGWSAGYAMTTPRNDYEYSLGVANYYLQYPDVAGKVHPLSNISPNFDTLNYSYKVRSIPVFAEGQLKALKMGQMQPYVLGGIGASWNRVNTYQEKATDPNGTASPMTSPFAGHSNTQFAYELGVGLSLPATCKVALSLGYRYFDLGRISLGTSDVQTTSERLSVGRIRTHALIFGVTWK